MIDLEKSEPARSLPEPTTPLSQSTLSVLKKLSGAMARPTLTVLSTVDPRIGACATIAYHSWAVLHSYFASKVGSTPSNGVSHTENNQLLSQKKR